MQQIELPIYYMRARPSTYHITELIHLKCEADDAVLILFVVAVDKFLVLLIHRLAVRLLLAAYVLLPELCL